MATKKKLVGVHRVLLLLRTSLLASVLTLEVPLPAVLASDLMCVLCALLVLLLTT